MAAESNTHLLESNGVSNDRIELDGLEGFFEDNHEELYSRGLTLKQAVFYYGDTRKSLKAKVLSGSIPAIRLPEAYGGKWRVFPDGVPPQLQDLIPEKRRPKDKREKLSLQPAEPQPDEPTKTEEPVELASEQMQSPGLPAEEPTDDKDNNLDFSVPGIDCPGQLILKAAGFLVVDEDVSSPALPVEALLSDTAEILQVIPAEAMESAPEIRPDPVEELPEQAIEPVATGSIRQDTPEAAAILASIETTVQYVQMLEKINELEIRLADASYRNGYLETRLGSLEDQVKFLTQAHCQKRCFNELVLVIPALALLAAILIFRFFGPIQL